MDELYSFTYTVFADEFIEQTLTRVLFLEDIMAIKRISTVHQIGIELFHHRSG